MLPVRIFGQEMSIKSFSLAETDLTANTPGTMREDQNGFVCALIKIESPVDVLVDVGTLGVTGDIERVGGEQWVYVPYGVRKITLSHPKLGVIRDYSLPCPVEKGRTYILKLNVSLPNNVTYDSGKMQKVRILVSPADAKVTLNGISLPSAAHGVYEEELAHGSYEIAVSSEKYYKQTSRIEVNDKSFNKTFKISLKQAFGWIQISGTGDEKLYVDGNHVPMSGGRADVISGHHRVLLEKPLHRSYETLVEVADSVVTFLYPDFIANYRELEFRVSDAVAMWVDGVHVTNGRTWKGKLEYGTHVIQCSKDNHYPSEMVLDVTPNLVGPINLPSPEPICGVLTVNSTPAGAEVYVDDVLMGLTPASFPVTIGNKSLTVKKSGYNVETRAVTIREGETTAINVALNNIVPVSIKSDPQATLFIDGKRMGTTQWNGRLSSGEYMVSLYASKYKDFKKKITVNDKHKDFSFHMKRIHYFDDGMVVSLNIDDVSIGGLAGFYLDKTYVEGNCYYGLSSERVTWNSTYTNALAPYTYTPIFIGGKIGYGLILGTRMRLTPFVGVTSTTLEGVAEDEVSLDFDASSAISLAANAGVRLSIALSPSVEFNVTREYMYSIYKDEIYTSLYDMSPAVKTWTEGTRWNFGIGLYL